MMDHHNERPLYHDDNMPSAKKFKVDESETPSGYQIAIIVPIMAGRFKYTIGTYKSWSRNGFDVVLVFNKDEEEAIFSLLQQHAPDMMTSFQLHSYTTTTPPNAGIAKNEAYCILLQYLDQPQFQFALLLDDTVNNINTRTGKSIMSNPTEFYNTVIRFAEQSPVFGGTVAYKRHPEKCKQGGVARVKRAFLQQALIFSCRGAPTLTKHFKTAEEYTMKMRRSSYRRVPFGEDVSFQVALYEYGVLTQRESPQFWGIGVSRIRHKSATKRQFEELDDKAKEALKDMMIYLQEQNTLRIDPHSNELTEVRVIPGEHICIPIKGNEGERPWRDAYKACLPKQY